MNKPVPPNFLEIELTSFSSGAPYRTFPMTQIRIMIWNRGKVNHRKENNCLSLNNRVKHIFHSRLLSHLISPILMLLGTKYGRSAARFCDNLRVDYASFTRQMWIYANYKHNSSPTLAPKLPILLSTLTNRSLRVGRENKSLGILTRSISGRYLSHCRATEIEWIVLSYTLSMISLGLCQGIFATNF